MIERLESRIAPAAVTVSYTDFDGDKVRITDSSGTLTSADLHFVGGGTSGQLSTLDLSDPGFEGANITFTVTKSAAGDGLANVGLIDAGINDLGKVIVVGDLGALRAGSDSTAANAPAAVKLLKVRSMGIFGLATQGGSGDLNTVLSGALNTLVVAGNIDGASLTIGSAVNQASLGSVTIGGFLLGEGSNSGYIHSFGDIGAMKISHDVRGGAGTFSGVVESGGKIASLSIGGSLIGGAAADSGFILNGGNMGPVTVAGSVVGGQGNDSGEIFSEGNIGPVSVHGNLLGSSIGGTAPDLSNTGIILANGRIASAFIGGSIIAGVDNSTGGDLNMNAGVRAGFDIGALTVKGSLIGSATPNGITHAVITAVGQQSPTATTDVAIGKIAIGGQVDLALIVAGRNTDLSPANGNAQIGPVTVGGDWIASSLGAGVRNTVDLTLLGNGHDSIIPGGVGPSIAKIVSVTIGGIVEGSDASNDHFGFVSHSIGAFKSLGFSAGPTTVASNPSRIVIPTITGDVAIEAV